MSLEGFGQGKARSEEEAFRNEAKGAWSGSLENKAEGLKDIDGSELTPGYQGYEAVNETAELATPVPERTEAPAGFDGIELFTEDVSVDAAEEPVVSAEEPETVASDESVDEAPTVIDMAAQEAAIDNSPNVARLDEARAARLAELEEKVMNPPTVTEAEPSTPEKKSWLQRMFGG